MRPSPPERARFRTATRRLTRAPRAQILLECIEISGHTVGGSVAEYTPGSNSGLNEANLSETESGWTIQEYCRILPEERQFLKVGCRRCVRLYHSEAKAFLTDGTTPFHETSNL